MLYNRGLCNDSLLEIARRRREKSELSIVLVNFHWISSVSVVKSLREPTSNLLSLPSISISLLRAIIAVEITNNQCQ